MDEEKDPARRGSPAGVCPRHRPLRSPCPRRLTRTNFQYRSRPRIRRWDKGARNKTTATFGAEEDTQRGPQLGPRAGSSRNLPQGPANDTQEVREEPVPHNRTKVIQMA
jgi:hypothetical protein